MRMLIFGGRDFVFDRTARTYLDELASVYHVEEVVQGGARGADRAGAEWARKGGIPVTTFEPAWRTANGVLNKAAGLLRNERMVRYVASGPAIAVHFPGHNGTAHTRSLLRRLKQIKTFDFPLTDPK